MCAMAIFYGLLKVTTLFLLLSVVLTTATARESADKSRRMYPQKVRQQQEQAADVNVNFKEPSPKTEYYVDLGIYGTFELDISDDEGTMTWKADLNNIDILAAELDIVGGIAQLNYHLHSFWTLQEDFAIGGTDCGPSNTGGHYDPFFGCGPASGIPDANCNGAGRIKDATRYMCSPTQYEDGKYDACEVGDLSGKAGPLIVDSDGNARGESDFPDPLAALNAHFVDARASASFDKWGSIVFHNGSPRVLCAKLFKRGG